MDLEDRLREIETRRERDRHTYETLDEDACMLCGAYGADKRNLTLNCLYDASEAVPEALDLTQHAPVNAWYLRICKTCRGRLLQHLATWRADCVSYRLVPKDHDGSPELDAPDAIVPVRLYGATVMLTPEQYQAYRKKREEKG